MVQSRINKKLNYPERRDIFKEDIGELASMYQIEIHGLLVAITIGKVKTEHRGVVYVPIYIIGDGKHKEPVIKSQIGLYEFDEKVALAALGSSTTINEEYIDEPLIYSFVTLVYLKRMESNPSSYDQLDDTVDDLPIKKGGGGTNIQQNQLPLTDDEPIIDEIDVALSLDKTTQSLSREKKNINEKLEHGVFRVLKNFEKPLYLEEETEGIANDYKKHFQVTKDAPWIQQMMKNSNYEIENMPENGDCLFEVIKEAYRAIGRETSIDTLRALVANDVTETIYEDRRELYTILKKENDAVFAKMRTLKEFIENPVTRAEMQKKGMSKKKREAMMETINEKVNEYNDIVKTDWAYNQANLAEFNYMKDIDSIDDLRKYILTSNFWADAWAIRILERVLNMRLIIFGEEDFEDENFSNVIHSGETPDEDTQVFNPEFYVMTSYSGDHYRLITYKDRKILTFREIPYDVKIMIVKKCMEKNSGVYSLIPAFRDFKSRVFMSTSQDDLTALSRGGSMTLDRDLYSLDTVLIFSEKGSRRNPGKESQDVVKSEMLSNFSHLASVNYWRRKLDDSYELEKGLFQLDGHRWKSVSQYLLAAQFKKGFPTIYLKYAMESNSNISKDLYTARHAMNHNKTAIMIDGVETSPIHVDAGFDTIVEADGTERKGRDYEERELALTAKFTQNADLKAMLLYTRDALLLQFVKQSEPIADELLMKLRQKLLRERN